MSEQENIHISLNKIGKSFDSGQVKVLHNINIDIHRGEIAALWGSSGSGKTTLLHIIGGLDSPDLGSLRIAGINPSSKKDRLRLRREKIGFIFQLHNLIADLTLIENCLITAIASGQPTEKYRKRFERLATLLKIDHLQNKRIQDLSGGERQRVAICRALMHKPEIILADEPTGSLDEKTSETVFELLNKMAQEENVTVVIATHERRFAESCDRIFHVTNGEVTERHL